ncbi:hypothetical protein [Serratia nevei]|uniref:hypothetical protein n=1 Tax=Serratia nevei TaxID=2703794 RepID=UPI0018D69D9C|nr:hypothetical protein [Serratia marcescens]MBI6126321.1 hypothetical protein [Serratia marcescens]MBN5301058.1 hypothetical protein [Serratia marcescens]
MDSSQVRTEAAIQSSAVTTAIVAPERILGESGRWRRGGADDVLVTPRSIADWLRLLPNARHAAHLLQPAEVDGWAIGHINMSRPATPRFGRG